MANHFPAAAGAARTPVSVAAPRTMGLRDVALFYVVTGISLRWTPFAAQAGPTALLIWAVAFCVFFLPLAATILELSGRYPSEGGLYDWIREAFGERPAFLAGWMYWASTLPFFAGALYFSAASSLFVWNDGRSALATEPGFFITFALGSLAVMALLNIRGLAWGAALHNLGALGMCVGSGVLIVTAALSLVRFGPDIQVRSIDFAPHGGLKELLIWSTLLFAFAGPEAASFLSEEVREPRRTLPLGLLIGGTLVTLGYLGGTAAIVYTLPHTQTTGLEGFMRAVSLASRRVGAPLLVPITAIFVALSEIGAAGAFLAAMARLTYVAGIDRYLPPVFARLHPRFRTPYVALAAYAFLGALFAIAGQAGTSVRGAYDVMITLTIVPYFSAFLFMFAAMIRLQRRPAPQGIFRVPGGSRVAIALACIGFAATSFTLIVSLIPEPDDPAKTLTLIKTLGGSFLILAIGALLFKLRHGTSPRTSAAASDER